MGRSDRIGKHETTGGETAPVLDAALQSPELAREEHPRVLPPQTVEGLAERALGALGLEDHLAVVIAHNDTDHAHWHLVVCKVHPDRGKAASLGRSGLRLSKVAEQWEREHGGIVIDNRVRRRQARERYADSVAGRMSDFKPDRNAATSQAKAEQRAAALDAARRRARALHPLPPAERSRGPGRRPRTDVERDDWERVYERERRMHTTPPQTRTERFRQRLQRRLRKAGASRERARATAERLVPRPRRRHGVLRRPGPASRPRSAGPSTASPRASSACSASDGG